MKKLSVPLDDPLTAFDVCVASIGDVAERQRYASDRGHVAAAVAQFDLASANANWCLLPRVPRGNPGTLVAGNLTKGDFKALYETYMVGAKGASRDIYNKLIASSGGLCPFCGELGQVRNLDHYLPKANFPAHSVNPRNLIPACRDCNTGKNASMGTTCEEQMLHPYLDAGHFFEVRWIKARVRKENPIVIEFECVCPDEWLDSDKLRVASHFEGYDIASRFSVQAGGEITTIVESRARSLRSLSSVEFRDYLLDGANVASLVLNGWRRTMYQALAESDWFIATDFSNPNWVLD